MSGKLPSRWGGFPHIPSAACSVGSDLSGHPTVMWGLVTVTYASVSTVTRHRLSLTQFYVTRLGSGLSVMSQHVVGGLNVYAGISPILRDSLVSRRLATPPVRLYVVSRSPFGPSCRCVSWRPFVSFSAPVVVFCLPPVGSVTPEVACLPTFPVRRSSFVTSPGWGRSAPPECPGIRVLGSS
jgi:hypothetical protein